MAKEKNQKANAPKTVYVLGAHPVLPVNQVFRISAYEGLDKFWNKK